MCTRQWWHKAVPIVSRAGASHQLPHVHNAAMSLPEHQAHGVHDTSMGVLTNFTLMLALRELLVQQNWWKLDPLHSPLLLEHDKTSALSPWICPFVPLDITISPVKYTRHCW